MGENDGRVREGHGIETCQRGWIVLDNEEHEVKDEAPWEATEERVVYLKMEERVWD